MDQLSTEDRLQIADIVASYCYAIDQRRWDSFYDLFTADCRLDFGNVMGVFEGQEGLRRFTATMSGLDLFMRHYTTNLVVRGDTARARADSYVLAITGSGAAQHQATGRYEDELVKIDGRWRIRERRAIIELAA